MVAADMNMVIKYVGYTLSLHFENLFGKLVLDYGFILVNCKLGLGCEIFLVN